MSVLPTLFTLGNLLAGFAALFYASRPESFVGPWGQWSGLTMAGTLVFLGLVLDAVDGSVARLTRSTSEFGGQLDSFADAVTFGVAPAFITLCLVGRYLDADPGVVILGPEADIVLGKMVWGAAAVYVCCAALRLARFNVEVGAGRINEHRSFHGLPSPGAAGCVVSLVLLHQHLLAKFPDDLPVQLMRGAALGIPIIMLLCAVAMVTTMPYVHVSNRYLEGPRSFGYVVRLVVPLFLAAWFFQETVAVAFSAYALSGPVNAVRRRLRPASARAPDGVADEVIEEAG